MESRRLTPHEKNQQGKNTQKKAMDRETTENSGDLSVDDMIHYRQAGTHAAADLNVLLDDAKGSASESPLKDEVK